jgi:hypothetical protein
MMLTIADHAFALLLVLFLPLYGMREWRALVTASAAGRPRARLDGYRHTILLEWGLVASLLGLWFAAGRPLPLLGLALPGGWRLLWGVGATLLMLALLWLQWRTVRDGGPDTLDALRRQVGSVAPLLPRTTAEYRRFRWLALTAGTAEELLYRGFLIWYFAALLGTWPGTVAAVLAFAAGHAYQGIGGVLKTGIVGALLTGIYIASGSLLWPMIVHCAIDLQGGAFGRVLLPPSPEALADT